LLATALIVSGCGSNSTTSRKTLAQVTPDVAGADPRLVQITKQSSQLLPGGAPAFDARMKELKGLPVVVNKWAHWCGPCVAEFPEFQQTSKKLGNRVAFLGVNVYDSNSKAKQFLRKFPVAYPSYSDPNVEISKQFPPPKYAPVTNIYDPGGRLVHTEAGPYKSAAALEADIERYAGPLKAAPNN
jgi:cytochrome c biogenesis protein CcmG/thiol:disulfide interchange protein DsbE